MSVVLEVSERRPPAGWLRTDEGTRKPFGGWLELMGLLEAVLGEATDDKEQRAS